MELLDTTLPKLVGFAKELLPEVAEFYKLTDPAHRIDHIEWVMANVLTIYNTVDLGLHDEYQKEAIFRQALLAAAYHDIYSHERKFHHFMSFQYVLDNADHFYEKHKLNKMQMFNVAYACMEHRGSWKGPYHSLTSEIVAAADRGIPTEFDMEDALKRSYLYARTTGNMNVPDAQLHSVAHLKDKYGANGYGRVPKWYTEHWYAELRLRSARLEVLTHEAVDPFMIYRWEEIIAGKGNGNS